MQKKHNLSCVLLPDLVLITMICSTLIGASPLLLRGAAGSDVVGRKKACWGCAEGRAVVAQRRNAHRHTRQGTGERLNRCALLP